MTETAAEATDEVLQAEESADENPAIEEPTLAEEKELPLGENESV